ncbi:YezD family protein [Parasporobacterium paucivorans]|uniref:Uncharacterized small protein n=1 Tax=Parasporobacterium paucivorans DSM 15970 TaxID=1122934 RepID=A0A1M6E231_9FIRM|nr:YezD family protein [Parasporobacterium paucivorans]SHI79594.1 Uncharacterized small protein [Parasporobacterium paucivorans DSM 15970]
MDKVNDKNKGDFAKIIELANTIQYGSITVIIQDGRIIQIEKNEKIRLK